MLFFCSYTSTFNLIDYSCIAFPYSKVDVELDQQIGEYTPMSEDDRILHRNCKSILLSLSLFARLNIFNHQDTPSDYKNAPLSLQLVAKRFRDEELLEALELIEKIIKN